MKVNKLSLALLAAATFICAAGSCANTYAVNLTDNEEISKSKEATELDENKKTNITITMPGRGQQLYTDIVLVLDKSQSANAVKANAIAMLQDLKTQTDNTGAKVKVGVVIFNSVANSYGLLDLESEYDEIVDAINAKHSTGTNTHAGLLAGKAMLDGDTEVDASRKYLVFVSDGVSYMYNETPTATAWSFNIPASKGDYFGKGNWRTFASPENYASQYDNNNAPADWGKWLANVEAKMQKQGTAYEYTWYKNVPDPDTSVSTPQNRDSETGAAGQAWRDYANSVDIALYKTWEAYQDICDSYNCYAMSLNQATYPWGPSFMNYLADGKTVSFNEIENDILYLFDKGSELVDEMGYGDDYDFDFVDEADQISIKVGEENKLPAQKVEARENATSTYIFGENEEYVLNYYKNETKDTEGRKNDFYRLIFNTPILINQPVSLCYWAELVEAPSKPGTYGQYDQDGSKGYEGLETNHQATITPVDTNGVTGEPEDFNKPTVSLTVEEQEEPGMGGQEEDSTEEVENPNTEDGIAKYFVIMLSSIIALGAVNTIKKN